MINYEQAKEIALKKYPSINAVLEYKDAYVFYNSKARGSDTEDNNIVILKNSGKEISMTEYAVTTKDESEPIRRKF